MEIKVLSAQESSTLFQYLSMVYTHMAVAPDWLLGALFGFGDFFGMYFGARAQMYVSPRLIKGILCGCVLFVAARYIATFCGLQRKLCTRAVGILQGGSDPKPLFETVRLDFSHRINFSNRRLFRRLLVVERGIQ